jgi:hypothetical protein
MSVTYFSPVILLPLPNFASNLIQLNPRYAALTRHITAAAMTISITTPTPIDTIVTYFIKARQNISPKNQTQIIRRLTACGCYTVLSPTSSFAIEHANESTVGEFAT